MNIEILPYQRISNAGGNLEKNKGKNLMKEFLSANTAILMPTAFLLGRASLIGGLMPFGMAAYAATLGFEVNRILIAVCVLLGMISAGAKVQIYITVAAMLLFNAFNLPFRDRTRQNFRHALIAFISIMIPEIVTIYLQDFLLYDILKALLHGFITFLLVFIFKNAAAVIDTRQRKAVLSGEEIISTAIIAALAVSGLGNIGIFGVNIKNILCILIILIFSYKCGPGVGAASGVTIGLLVSISSTITPLVIASFAFCGLLAGVLKSLGKIGSLLGFVMGNTLLTLYANGSTEVLIYLNEILIAGAAFMAIPKKVMNGVAEYFLRDAADRVDKRCYSLRIKEITVDKLNKFSGAFKELSKTFSEISETRTVTDKQDISTLFDSVADKICKDCSLCLHCWERNFYNTYQVMFQIIERLEGKGRIDESDIPAYFMDRCERIHDFVNAVNNVYEIFKVDMVWRNKVNESRGLVSQQLDGLSHVISNLASEINMDIHFKSELENLLLLELNKEGVRASEAIVYENKWGKYEISIFHKGCGGKRKCVTVIEKLVSGITGRKMVKEAGECYYHPKDRRCSLRLTEEESFKVTTGVARVAKENENISGDSYTFMSTGEGKYIVALSDGMGSGQKAANQSRATISLLEQFMESGFDKDTTIKLINSVLVLKSSDDSFSTIDLSVIDLYSGEVEFVKIGAVPTYIKRNDGVEALKSASLPAGILSEVEVDLVHKKVENGNFIIMMTDGILDAFKKEETIRLEEYIGSINSTNPQEIADMILTKAYEYSEGVPADDMLVLTAKVWRTVG